MAFNSLPIIILREEMSKKMFSMCMKTKYFNYDFTIGK